MRTLHAVLLALAATLSLAGCNTPNQTYREQGIELYNQAQAAEAAKDPATAEAKYDSALEAFDKSLADRASDPAANAYKAAVHYHKGQYEVAAYYSHLALQYDPSNEQARTVMIGARIKQDKADIALDALERLSGLADHTKDPRPQKGNWARPYTLQVEERLYYSPVNNRYEIGRVYESLGDLDNAALWYGRALEKANNNPTILVSLVKLFERAGNRPRMIETIQKAYAADPGSPELLAIINRNNIAISEVSPR